MTSQELSGVCSKILQAWTLMRLQMNPRFALLTKLKGLPLLQFCITYE